MSTEILVVTAQQQHLRALIELGTSYYEPGHHALTPEFLRWLYLDNPTGAAQLVVAQEGDQWIGVIVLVPVALRLSSAPQLACFAVNVLTHPAHRGKNLFVKMICVARDHLKAEGRWLLGHPNRNAMPGWKRQKMQFRPPLLPFFAKPRRPLSPMVPTPVMTRAQLDALPGEFWRALNERPGVHIERSARQMSWRLLEPPHKRYQLSIVRQRDRSTSLLATTDFKGPVRLLVDYASLDGSFAALRANWRQPLLVMHPGGQEIQSASLISLERFGLNKQIPFFATTWGQDLALDWSSITLAASDF